MMLSSWLVIMISIEPLPAFKSAYLYFKLASNVDNQNQWVEVIIFDFYVKKRSKPPIYLNNVEIPPSATVKCIRLHLDSKLNWTVHIIKKRKQMELRHKELYWLLGRKSHLSVDKLLLYNSLIAPIWTRGIELWDCACKSNIAVIQRCQLKILR
jgi:hypothetical protein